MAAVRSDRIGIPVGLHERRVLAWLRSRADDSLANLLRDHLEIDPLAEEVAAGVSLPQSSGGAVHRADHVGGTIQARPVVAAR